MHCYSSISVFNINCDFNDKDLCGYHSNWTTATSLPGLNSTTNTISGKQKKMFQGEGWGVNLFGLICLDWEKVLVYMGVSKQGSSTSHVN
jgi:hypothetical protein